MASRDENGFMRCTIEAITGLGKTFISLHLIKILQPKSVLFLAETQLREQTILDDIAKFKQLFEYDILANHKIEFMCYQSAYKKHGMFHEMVVADEIHDSLTPEYFKYYLYNKYNHLLGLSATIDKKTKYLDEVNNEYTKLDMLDSIAPVAASYTIKQGQDENISRKLKIIVIDHELDNVEKTINVEWKKDGVTKVFQQTEKAYYEYCHAAFIKALYSNNKSDFLIRYWARKRNDLLYTLPSKTKAVIELLKTHNLNRNIIFANSITELDKICPTVSSHNSPEKNQQIIKSFNDGFYNTIGSFKMLKQGMNLNNLNNVIIHSYYSVEKDFIQRVGRLRRSDDLGYVIIFSTRNTQEEVWLNKIMTSINLAFERHTLKSLKL